MKQDGLLEIDTSLRETTVVRFTMNGNVYEKKKNIASGSSQQVLPLIESILSEAKSSIDDITDIRVHTGPGSYTGLRVGVAIASTLGLLNRVKVNGLLGTLPKITYEKDPWT